MASEHFSPAELRAMVLRLTDIAVAAGARILECYRGPCEVEHKADGSPVTNADLAAEAVIAAGLAAGWPEVPTLSEEAAEHPAAMDDARPFLLIDPLDGTREYVNRTDEFTVNIALVVASAPILGVVYAPALGKLWRGVVGQGAEALDIDAQGPGEARQITARPRPEGALTAIASRSHLDPATSAFLAALPVRDCRSIGSSLKFCLIAEGLADVYPRFGPTMEWDTGAGHAVLAAAGGRVTTPAGEPFRYNKAGAGFRNGPFVAWGRG